MNHLKLVLSLAFATYAVPEALLASPGAIPSSAPSLGTEVIGNVDALILQQNTYYLRGWACQVAQPNPIAVHAYLDAPAGQNGEFLGDALANEPSEPAVGELCQTGADHRFLLPLTYEQVKMYAGRMLYVHGLAVSGPPHPVLNPSGSFSVPNVVDLSYVNANDSSSDLEIPPALVVQIDEDLNREFLKVHGALTCPYDGSYTVAVQGIVVDGAGAKVECGTEQTPFLGRIDFTMVGNQPLDPASEKPGKEFVARNGGVIRLIGRPGKSGVLKLAQTAEPGDWEIHVDTPVHGWEKYDRVVLTSTGFNPGEAEKRIITSISQDGLSFRVDVPLEFQHWGETQEFSSSTGNSWILDERAEVVNLTRNIRFGSDGSHDGKNIGAHMMISGVDSAGQPDHHSGGYIQDVEFYRVGQMANLGRYPFHWHKRGIVEGQYIRDSAIHDSYNRCVTIHGTHSAEVTGNTCYDHYGHGYFLEDGNERRNRIERNIGILSKRVPPGSELLQSESQELSITRFPGPATFWISNPDNYVNDNVAAGSEGTGFWMAFHEEILCQEPRDCIAVEGVPADDPVHTTTLEFDRNAAHSSLVGITHDGGPNGDPVANPHNAADREIVVTHYSPPELPVFVNLRAHKNSATGVYYRGEGGTYLDGIFADNAASLFFAYNSQVIDSLVVGISNNFDDSDLQELAGPPYLLADELIGILLYDGPFFLQGVHFAEFSSEQLLYNGIDYTPTAFHLMGGQARYVNRTTELTFAPEPLYRVKMHRDHARDHWADSYTVRLRDLDGSLSGFPGAEIAPNHPLNWEASCTHVPGWDAYACDYESAHLRFRNRKRVTVDGEDPVNAVDLNFSLQKNNGPIYMKDAISPNDSYNKFSMVPDSSNIYHVTDYVFEWQDPDEAQWIDLLFTSDHDQLSSVVGFEIPDSASCVVVESYAFSTTHNVLNSLDSLDALLDSDQHGQFLDDRTLYFKLRSSDDLGIVNDDLGTIRKEGLYGIACE